MNITMISASYPPRFKIIIRQGTIVENVLKICYTWTSLHKIHVFSLPGQRGFMIAGEQASPGDLIEFHSICEGAALLPKL
jgi:hypothetical protein